MAKIASEWNKGKHCKYIVDERTGETCDAPFVVEQTEIEIDPTQQGPKGGKVWVCAHHIEPEMPQQALDNPFYNPFMNAGRRLRGQRGGPSTANVYQGGALKGKPRKPALAAAPKPPNYYMGMSLGKRDKKTGQYTGELAQLAARGDTGAIAEINRRERSPAPGDRKGKSVFGVKAAWLVKKPKKGAALRDVANPFDY